VQNLFKCTKVSPRATFGYVTRVILPDHSQNLSHRFTDLLIPPSILLLAEPGIVVEPYELAVGVRNEVPTDWIPIHHRIVEAGAEALVAHGLSVDSAVVAGVVLATALVDVRHAGRAWTGHEPRQRFLKRTRHS
jgi:hypothetical protein